MVPAIEFQYESASQAHKIDDVVAERKLPPEFEIGEAAVAEFFPDELFWLGLCAAKVSGSLAVVRHVPPHP
jgi:hypothetical protein